MAILERGSVRQKLMLASGLVLFAFAATHFLNHAVGLVSLEAMHDVQHLRWSVTRSWPGSFILSLALLMHMVLALIKLATRATLRLPAWELVQIGLGLLIPFLLLPHIVNTRLASSVYGVEDNYLYELARLWPDGALLQSVLLIIVWLHGCIGIHFWLRLYPPYRKVQPILLFVAITLPLAALAGFMVSGRAVAALIQDGEMFAKVKDLTRWPDAPESEAIAWWRTFVRVSFAGILAVIGGYTALKYFGRMGASKLSINYLGGPTIRVAPGPTLLEYSRMHGIPHASICGGRARCSTCRVRIEEGAASLPPPQPAEALTLRSIEAPANVRLACQIRPTAPLVVSRLLRPASTAPSAADTEEADSAGIEKTLAVLFLDIRNFKELTKNLLPCDTVYMLNEFFAASGSAIRTNGGWIDKFLGDGLIAIFGQRHGLDEGCRQAARAARSIDLALDHVNAKLEAEIGRPVQVGMGIHAGPLLIGRIGFGEAVDLTVIGDTVHIASQLEGMTRTLGHQIVISRFCAYIIGLQPSEGYQTTTDLAGFDEPTVVIGIARGRDLPARLFEKPGPELDKVEPRNNSSVDETI